MTHASNVLGTVQPIEAIAAIVREAGALFLVDAAQSAGVVPIDLQRDADRPARLPRPQGPLRPDRHRRPLRRPAGQAPRLARGGDRRRLEDRDPARRLPYFLEGGHAQRPGRRRPGRRDRLGRRAGPGDAPAPRGRPAPAGRRLGRGTAEGWQVAGRWDPATARRRPLADRPRRRSTPQDLGSILDTSFEIAVRPGLHCAPYIHRAPRHLPRRHPPAQPRAVQHAEDDRRPSSTP